MFPLSLAVAAALTSLPAALPEGATARLGTARFRGPATWGAAFSPDGKSLHAPAEKSAYAWDVESGRRLPDIPCPTSDAKDQIDSSVVVGGRIVRMCCPPPLGKQFTGLVVNSLADGKEVLRVPTTDAVLVTSVNQIPYLAEVSADGNRFVMARPSDGVTVWDLPSGKVVKELGKEAFGAVAVSADGSVVCTLHGGRFCAWDVASGKKRTEVKVGDTLRLFRVSPDGKRAVAHAAKPPEVVDGKPVPARDPHSLRAWDLESGQELGRLPLEHRPYDLRFVGSDGVVVGVGEPDDRQARVLFRWNLKAPNAAWETPFSPPASSGLRSGWLVAHPNGKRFAVAGVGGPVTLFDATTGKRLSGADGHSEHVRAIHFSADGRTVYTLSNGEQRSWDAESGSPKRSADPPEVRGTHVGVHVVGGVGVWPTWTKNGTEVIGWDVEKGKVLWRFTPEFNHVIRVLSADGQRVLVLGGESSKPPYTFAVYDGPTGKTTHDWPCPREVSPSLPLALSPDGGRLWVATAKAIRGYGATRGGNTFEFAAEVGSSVRSSTGTLDRLIAVSPDGTRLATAGKGKGISIATLGREVHTRRLDGADVTPQGVVFSSDGKRVAAFDPRSSKAWVYDWDRPDDQTPKEFDAGGAGATAAAFSPDGKRLAVGYADGTALVWRLAK